MTIKTFDANRVGGGTFQIEQDATTGEYKIKEVGFVKLPELKLPEIDQAAYKTPTPYIPGTDPDTDLPDVGGVGSDGGGGDDQQDFTGMSTYKNIQDQATGGSDNLMNQATTFSGQNTGIQVENLTKDPEENTALLAYNQSLKLYNDAIAKADTKNPNEMKNVDEAKALVDRNRKFYEQSVAPGALFFEGNIPDRSIGDFSFTENPSGQTQGPRTVPAGTLTGGLRGVPDMIVQGQPALPDENIITKARDVINNSVAVKVITKGAEVVGTTLKGAATAILGPETNSQVHARKYFNIAGTSGQPQRIAGNPAENVFAGANANAKDLNRVAQKRIDTIEKNLAAGKYRDPDKKRQQLKDFKEQQANYKKDQRQEAIKRKGLDTKNPNEMRQADGGADSSPSSKIVCTMMNESYGFGSFRNKIWMKFHGNIAPEYQKGYHKLFLPLVSYAKQKGITNKIIKNILEHIAVHSTIDMRQTLRGKTHLLGRVYRKIILPLCYWAGRK